MIENMPDTAQIAFYAAFLDLCFPKGAAGACGGSPQGRANVMTSAVAGILSLLLARHECPVTVTVDMVNARAKALVIFNSATGTTALTKLKLTPQVARIGKQAVFLNDGKSAGLLLDAMVHEIKATKAAR